MAKQEKPKSKQGPRPDVGLTILRGQMFINTLAFPTAPLVGFADAVGIKQYPDSIHVTFFDSAARVPVFRVVLDPVGLVISVLPLIERFHAESLTWLEGAGLAPVPPSAEPMPTPAGSAVRAGFVRLARVGLEAEIEWYASPLLLRHFAEDAREAKREIAPAALGRIQLPLPVLCGFLARILELPSALSTQQTRVLAKMRSGTIKT